MKSRLYKAIGAAIAIFMGLIPFSPVALARQSRNNLSFLVPLYDSSGNDWSTACSDLSNTASSSVIADIGNPGGPGTSKSSTWATNIAHCGDAGVGVLGYVDTGFCSTALATAESQINSWYSWYQSSGLTGIIFDEVANPTSPTSKSDCLSGTSSASSYYQSLASYVHAKANRQSVVYSFGANPLSDWPLSSRSSNQNANVVVTFEDPYSEYADYAGSGAPWAPISWESNYGAADFSALVYDASGATLPAAFCSAVKRQNIGYVYITPNSAWTSLPASSYLNSELQDC